VQGAVRVAWRGRNLLGGVGLQPELPGRADRVRGQRQRPLLGGHHAAGRDDGAVGADAAVVGRCVEDQLRLRPPGPLQHPPDLQLWQGARRQQRHTCGVERRRRVPRYLSGGVAVTRARPRSGGCRGYEAAGTLSGLVYRHLVVLLVVLLML